MLSQWEELIDNQTCGVSDSGFQSYRSKEAPVIELEVHHSQIYKHCK